VENAGILRLCNPNVSQGESQGLDSGIEMRKENKQGGIKRWN
jgi:hypothetical protein